MSKWNLEKVGSQAGKVAVITGANSGIGFKTALALAQKGATVVAVCRTKEKAEATRNSILKNVPTAKVMPMTLNVARISDVKRFSEKFLATFKQLDLLVNNAGIMMSPYQITDEGFENQFATNYLGHFALTGLLLPLLNSTRGARVVTLSSLSYRWAKINFDDIHFKNGYSKKKAYGQSKRACLMFAFELQRRLSMKGHRTISLATHPGLSKTNLDRYFPSFIRPLGNLFLQSPQQGALNVLYAALHEKLKGGEYIGPDGFQEIRGNPTRVKADEYTKNNNVASHSWQVSERMTKVEYLPLLDQ